MNHETTFTHSDPNRFARQELAFRALFNRHADECLTAFAEKATVVAVARDQMGRDSRLHG